jgi:hypothetical protein
MEKITIVVAPHPDDEIIGCYEILKNEEPFIIYSPSVPAKRREEAMGLKKLFKIKGQLFQRHLPPTVRQENCTIYAPDPTYEIHPLHREIGARFEIMLRSGFDVIFYNTIMNAPYIHEVKDPKNKLTALDTVYFSQSDLWKYDHKYFLFEGRCKWLF